VVTAVHGSCPVRYFCLWLRSSSTTRAHDRKHCVHRIHGSSMYHISVCTF